jgi:hypothetical protein
MNFRLEHKYENGVVGYNMTTKQIRIYTKTRTLRKEVQKRVSNKYIKNSLSKYDILDPKPAAQSLTLQIHFNWSKICGIQP